MAATPWLHTEWVEEDPIEILDSVKSCISTAVGNLADLGLGAADITCVGVTNQGATTIVWDKMTGCPLYNAIVWLDTRTASTASDLVDKTPDKSIDHLRPLCGLPINACFSAVKLHWLLENSEAVCRAVQENRCLFGTVDSWLLWNLTGGINGGRHVTDVTNANTTMLMNLKTLQWDEELCSFFGVPKSILPEICSSSEIYGEITSGPLQHVPLSGILLDQQSAMVGQRCFSVGQAKNTYGTGCYLNFNTGAKSVESKTGMMTMVAYKFGPSQPPAYALMGGASVAGACVRWLRDNLGIISTSAEVGGPDVPVKFQETVVTSGACSASYEQLVHDLYNTSSPDVTAVGRGKLCARLQGPRGACPVCLRLASFIIVLSRATPVVPSCACVRALSCSYRQGSFSTEGTKKGADCRRSLTCSLESRPTFRGSVLS